MVSVTNRFPKGTIMHFLCHWASTYTFQTYLNIQGGGGGGDSDNIAYIHHHHCMPDAMIHSTISYLPV